MTEEKNVIKLLLSCSELTVEDEHVLTHADTRWYMPTLLLTGCQNCTICCSAASHSRQ